MAESIDDPYDLRAALAGDVAAWTAIVDEFSTTMWHWARATGLSREDAEDVCQAVWYLLADRGRGIHEPARLAGWLATTTRREALAVHRRRRRGGGSLGGGDLATWELPADDPTPEQVVAADDASARLAEAFATLRERCRELLSLLWSGVVSYDDVSEALGMPIGSIGPTRQRCLQQLRERAAIA